jgi:hypothetical protein
MSESTVTFRHEYNENFKLDGVRNVIKQSIIDGTKGLSFMYLKKVGESDFYKVYAKEVSPGKYEVEEIKGPNAEPVKSEASEAEVKKMALKTATTVKHTVATRLNTTILLITRLSSQLRQSIP